MDTGADVLIDTLPDGRVQLTAHSQSGAHWINEYHGGTRTVHLTDDKDEIDLVLKRMRGDGLRCRDRNPDDEPFVEHTEEDTADLE